jgi:uncharacterized protein
MSMNNSGTVSNHSLKPWYREPWPWLLMAGPFIVIVAGIVTAWLAVVTSDGLVTEDYYKQGQAAGETLAKSQRADELGLEVGVRLHEGGISVRLGGHAAAMPLPPGLTLTLSHPTRAGMDQQVPLKPAGSAYVGSLRLPASGHWLVLVEDEARSWRVMGSVVLPAAGEVVIGAAAGTVQR